MITIFMNSKNIQHLDSHRLLLNLAERMDLKASGKCVAVWNLSIHCTLKNMEIYKKKLYRINKFKISSHIMTKNDKFKLPDESYSVFHVQDYFETVSDW